MTEFYEVNTNAKNVSTNLAFTLLSKMAEEDPELREALAGADKDWITRGQAVIEELEELIGPWKGRFQLANTRKRRGDGVIMPMQQFVRSLKPVLDMPLLKRADPLTVANVINAYWLGIAQVLPEPFEGNPEEFVIRRGKAPWRCTRYCRRWSRSSAPTAGSWASRSSRRGHGRTASPQRSRRDRWAAGHCLRRRVLARWIGGLRVQR